MIIKLSGFTTISLFLLSFIPSHPFSSLVSDSWLFAIYSSSCESIIIVISQIDFLDYLHGNGPISNVWF